MKKNIYRAKQVGTFRKILEMKKDEHLRFIYVDENSKLKLKVLKCLTDNDSQEEDRNFSDINIKEVIGTDIEPEDTEVGIFGNYFYLILKDENGHQQQLGFNENTFLDLIEAVKKYDNSDGEVVVIEKKQQEEEKVYKADNPKINNLDNKNI